MDSWREFEQHLVEIDSDHKLVMKQSIYKVPASVKDLNPKAYIPQLVTFGPYHCNYERVTEMDVHKRRALNHFIKNSRKPFLVYENAMKKIQHELMASYESLDVNLHSSADKFLQHMLLDGCFMLEILRANIEIKYPGDKYGDYSETDPIFSYQGTMNVMPYIRTEMLMLENQLPMILLLKLLKVEAAVDIIK
ncbi:putative transmembrane protein, partial [Thalictrum thalictroides]